LKGVDGASFKHSVIPSDESTKELKVIITWPTWRSTT